MHICKNFRAYFNSLHYSLPLLTFSHDWTNRRVKNHAQALLILNLQAHQIGNLQTPLAHTRLALTCPTEKAETADSNNRVGSLPNG